MANIGVLYGMENAFPSALVQRINAKNVHGMKAESLRVGGVQTGSASGYAVIVDRVAQDLDFYEAYLKNAVLSGTHVLNNPFRWSADNKFVHYSLAKQLGLTVPATAIIPQKSHPPGTTAQSMRNLLFPLNWQEIFDQVGFPAYLKPLAHGSWMSVQRVNSADEFFAAYDKSGSSCMMLQSRVPHDSFFRCYVVGNEVRAMRYERSQPQHLRHISDSDTPKDVCDRLIHDASTLCQALGYDINAIDFAVKDGVPHLIDSYNPVPDADFHSVGRPTFEWIVNAVADLAIQKAQVPAPPVQDFTRIHGPQTARAVARS